MSAFDITLIVAVILIPGMIFFGDWWNRKHGLNSRGEPDERLSMRQHKEPKSG